MQSLLQILLSDAVGAAVLALLVSLVAPVCRRPALVRALWILVLLKLLTPPLWTLSLDRLLTRPDPPHHAIQPLAEPDAVLAIQAPSVLPDIPVAAPAAKAPQAVSLTTLVFDRALIAWAAGSAVMLLICLARVWAFSRILSSAAPADTNVRRHTALLARQLGLARVPEVWLVPSVVCPGLWAFGRAARIILPLDLWNRLDPAQRNSVLAHELAHLRRGDHWVRLLELIVTVIYWWHPAVWIARRQIHDCEEQCCDAWVLWAMPASAHSYGAALLEAVDFVSTHRPTRPALAAGLGEFRQLKRRLLMIKQQKVARALSRAGLLAVCSAAALALPFGPVFGQALPPGADGPSAEQAEAAAKNERQIAEARARVQRLRAQLLEAQSRLTLLEQAAGLPPDAPMGLPGGRPGMSMGGALPPDAGPRIGISGGSAGTSAGGATADMGSGGFAGGGFGGGGGVAGSGAVTGRIRTPEDRRLDRLEKQLQELMQQVRELKEQKGGENRDQPQADTPPAGANSSLPAARP